ncbi:hypothetical protein Ahy_A06g026586 isoform D [Arachis hypogaea]|uniref:Uncharacterized protein n=1 Tax=Arachis hypogaea TaxID=3818 RepID=A0A445CL17_ARAHY|nr:hypothetical protein Ahy_A06g026586 isoform D [Arachis hypogaea]
MLVQQIIAKFVPYSCPKLNLSRILTKELALILGLDFLGVMFVLNPTSLEEVGYGARPIYGLGFFILFGSGP